MTGSQAKLLRAKGQPKIIKMPSEVCIYHNESCSNFVAITNEMNNAVFAHGRAVVLDFSSTKKITGGAAVMLFAEVSRAQLITQIPNIVTIRRPLDSSLWQLMRDSGFWEAIKPGGEKKLQSLWDKGCPFSTGNDPDSHLALTLRSFRNARPDLPQRFDSAIQEAILNVVHHAYNYNNSGPMEELGTRWWQYAAITEEDVRFTICDLGIGIPRKILHFPENRHLPQGNCIEKAMMDGFSTLFGRGRGMGSRDLKRPVNNTEAESLSILSNNGLYSYNQNRELVCADRQACLPGTIVEWKMRVSA